MMFKRSIEEQRRRERAAILVVFAFVIGYLILAIGASS